MAAIEVSGLAYRYGKVAALRGVDLVVPEGSLYALLGPNGAGKTTLMQILMGSREAGEGRVSVLGKALPLAPRDRATIGYVAEGQPLPGWMRLHQVEAYLEPLYPSWDRALANDLRRRFRLDPQRRTRSLSRGEQMKASLLCALAARPRLLLMDEPFAGMDAVVKDDLVRGLLASAAGEGCTVLLCSHDIGELEVLADRIGFLCDGRIMLEESLEEVRARFRHVDVITGNGSPPGPAGLSADWLAVERAGPRLSFVASLTEPEVGELELKFPGAIRVDVRPATLREIFVALARRAQSGDTEIV
jgi:ABC-2 type transport system ATP-binding protein